MRPATLHYVATLEPTLVYGRHFYSSSTLKETCFGAMHTLIADHVLSNTEHSHLLHFIPAFGRWWLQHLDDLASRPQVAMRFPCTYF